MKNEITTAEKSVGLMLANGFTKKEVANALHKSVRTVDRQTDDLYKKTGSRNLSDITRYMIRRYTNVNVEDVLIHAMHDITLAVVVCLAVWAVNALGGFEELKAALSQLETSIINTLK